MWSDQPTVHHSVWEDHFHSYHTSQHTFLLTIRHHRPGSGAAVLCKGSRSYTEWKWYLQQLGVGDYLHRCVSNTTTLNICTYVILNSKHKNVIMFVYSDLFPAFPLLQWVTHETSPWHHCPPEEQSESPGLLQLSCVI